MSVFSGTAPVASLSCLLHSGEFHLVVHVGRAVVSQVRNCAPVLSLPVTYKKLFAQTIPATIHRLSRTPLFLAAATAATAALLGCSQIWHSLHSLRLSFQRKQKCTLMSSAESRSTSTVLQGKKGSGADKYVCSGSCQ